MSHLASYNFAPRSAPPVLLTTPMTPTLAYPGAMVMPTQTYYNLAPQPPTPMIRPQIQIPTPPVEDAQTSGAQTSGAPTAMVPLYHPQMFYYNPYVIPQQQLQPQMGNAAPNPPTPSIPTLPPAAGTIVQQTPQLNTPAHLSDNPNFLFALSLFQEERYAEFQSFVKNNTFDSANTKKVQEMWYDSLYIVYLRKNKTQLSPMIRYRLRKKYPLPSTIWDGEHLSYNLRQSSRNLLIEFFERNRYPTIAEKKMLAGKTGMDVKSVTHWFKNRRSRCKEAPQRQTSDSGSDGGAPSNTQIPPIEATEAEIDIEKLMLELESEIKEE